MRTTVLSSLESLPYFTIEGFRQIAGRNITNDSNTRIRLNRWVNAGSLVALKKGIYMHNRFYERHKQEVAFSAVVSAILEPLSYVSLEFVLLQKGILTEVTYPITSVTTKNTHTIINSIGTFVYRHIHPNLYNGYQIDETYGIPYAKASVAKALFDYLYLRPQALRIALPEFNLAEELRLNLDEFNHSEREEFTGYVIASGKNKMTRILLNLERHVWQH